ncbi:Disease resistance protein [Cinnamomum micranthum f. kanehirae]|uniref:Disease resistance protein n=1 Tax=Cinnamomum micranthum f. kanehirae TaxID=337451 RepID=A0A3S3NX60_9MAGN|nr:Disease resistance protein [Cinnamomum micranthum f. kanehirae]
MASEVAVSIVVGKLGDLLIEEARLLYDVRDQFEWIVGELRRMQCFLKDADAKQKEDEGVRNWVKEIRDVSYDAEDVIDTFILTQTAQAYRRTRRRPFLYLKRYVCIVSELATRHRVAKKIQHIKKKIGDISSSLQTYGIRDINDGGQETRLNILRRAYALYEEPDLIGMQESMATLKEQLINEEARRCVISIVGMGGSGKTTLAKKVYHDVKDNFDCHAFIYLSQQYGLRDVLIRIIECVMGLSREEKENSNEEDLRKKLRDHLKKKRYLVVIDDIWTMQAWDGLKLFLPDGLSKSRVVLTTRNKEVALHADNVIDHHYIRLLNEYESWELFHKKIFPKGVVCPLELMETGRKILEKCCGLPLAIVVLGGLLSRRDMTFSAWTRVLNSVTWHLAEDSNRCMEILALSYSDLPHYLKTCFLYLGLFPEDYEIESKELIKLWVAEGFIQERGNEIMEDVAEDYLEELIGRSMIQVARKRSNGSVSTCRIHDLLRDLSMSEARQVNFFGIYGDNDATSSSSSLRRVALHLNVDEHEIINCSAATLRSMLCFSDSSFRLSRLLKRGGKLLRVLHVDIADLQENNLPNEIGEEVHLRYLKVNGIQSLPSSLKRLSNLQVIILSGGGTLPSAIWDLERLRHLYAYQWDIDGHPRLSNFRNLQTLCLEAGSWIEDGLDKLTNIRKLGVTGHLRRYHKALSDAIEKWCNLRSLTLYGSSSIPPFVSFAHHQNLYKITLENSRIENLPMMPPHLAKLSLCEAQLKQNAIEILEKLQNLRILYLKSDSYYSEKMICSSGGFPQLEYLLLYCSNLKDWTVEKGAMESLKKVILSHCRHWTVKEGAMKSLEEVELFNCKHWTVEEGAMQFLKEVKLSSCENLRADVPKHVQDLLEH